MFVFVPIVQGVVATSLPRKKSDLLQDAALIKLTNVVYSCRLTYKLCVHVDDDLYNICLICRIAC